MAAAYDSVRSTQGIVRVAADACGLAAGLVTAVVVARSLGADGKGIVSALGYMTVLLGATAALGMGEAGVILVGRRTLSFDDAVRVTIAVLVLSTASAGTALLVLTGFGWGVESLGTGWGPLAAALAVAPTAVTSALARLLEARGRFNAASAGRAAMSITTAVATCVLLIPLHGGVTSAVLAMLLGATAYLLVLVRSLRQLGVSVRPRLSPGSIRQLLRIGLPIQAATVMVGLTSRIDLLILMSYRGASAAGRYGVATTVAGLASYAATALAALAFPHVSSLSPRESAERTAIMTRWAFIVSAVSAALLAVTAPLAIPLLFGGDFERSVRLTLLLLPGAVFAAGQWVLGRLGASSGMGSVIVMSHSVGLAVLVGGAFLLVPAAGEEGAAAASVAASLVGFGVAARAWSRHTGLRLGALVPRSGDVSTIVDALLRDLPFERVRRLQCRFVRRLPPPARPRAAEPPGS